MTPDEIVQALRLLAINTNDNILPYGLGAIADLIEVIQAREACYRAALEDIASGGLIRHGDPFEKIVVLECTARAALNQK